MDKLYAIAAFVKIVDAGSITAAAQELDVSQPAMVRTLAALERELGVRLLNRTTRRMSLTDEGREYYERAGQIIAAVEDAQRSLSARRETPSGRLRIASSVPFGRAFVAPVVSDFLIANRQVNVELLLLDRIVDLVEEGMDVAVRVAVLPDSSMIAHTIGQARRVVVASKGLIKTLGLPASPIDLRDLPCVSFTGVASAGHWSFEPVRKPIQVAVKNVLVTNQIDAAILACANGLGFGRFFDYHVTEQLRSGQLVTVLEKFEGEPTPISIVYPSTRHLSSNVRSFVNFSLPRLRKLLSAVTSVSEP